jgi:hypothetical protein
MTTPNPKIFRRVAAAALSFSGLSAAFAEPIFTPYTAMPTGSWPEATAIGDVNGDGLKDVVMTTSYYFDAENDYKLFVFLQDANGQLQTPIKYAAQGTYPSPPQSVDIGDVNGDGKNDVVVGNDRASIQIFLQDPNGNLTPSSVHATQNSTVIKIGDLNGDGRLDIAGIGHGTANASVLYQNPDGTLAPPVSFSAPHGGFDDLDIGDINGDGKNDLIVMSGQNYTYANLAVLTQNSSGSFNSVVFYDLGENVNTQGLGVGDVNGDQLNDVIVSYGGNSPASNISIFHQQQSGILSNAPISLPSYDIPEPVEIKDVTGDGLSDIVVLHGGWHSLGVYVQTVDGNLSPEQLFTIPSASHYNVQGLALDDINNDGLTDAVIADSNHGLIILYQEAEGANHAPVAEAGPDQYLEWGSSPLQVVLDGANSIDPDNDALSYYWTLSAPAGSSAVLNDQTLPNPVFTADVTGTYTVQLQVYDGTSYSQTDTVTISVMQAPIADAGPDQYLQLGTSPLQVFLDGSNSRDPDNDNLSYYWGLSAPSGSNAVLDDYTRANPQFTADVTGTYTAYLVVFDGKTYSQMDTTTITVTSTNLPPLANAGPDQQLQLGQNPLQVLLDGGSSSDPDGSPLSFNWTLSAPTGSNAVLNDKTLATPSFTADIAGTYTAQLQVFDSKAYSQIDTVTITIQPAPNLPPIATAIVNTGSGTTVRQDTITYLDGSPSKDPDGTITSWSWTQIGGPAVALNNATGVKSSFKAPKLKGQTNLLLTFKLTVTDDDGAQSTGLVQVTVVK